MNINKKKTVFSHLKSCFSVAALILSINNAYAAPPYSGTVFIVPDTITASDPRALGSTEYVTRTDEVWVFKLLFNDSLTTEVHVEASVGSQADARKEVDKIAYAVGQLPLSNRRELAKVHIYAGEGRAHAKSAEGAFFLYADSNNDRIRQGNLEELLLHESTHVAIDPYVRNTQGWRDAQQKDGEFISTYARDNHVTEDIAETFGLYLTYRYKKNRLTPQETQNIERAMSARIAYFDSLNLDLYPFSPLKEGEGFVVSPAPLSLLQPYRTTFTVNTTAEVTLFDMLVGTNGAGSDNLRASAVQSSKRFDVQNLPTNGETIYVRLWTYKNAWQYKDYTYIADRPSAKATLLSHTDGDVLTSSTVTFKWDHVDRVDSYDLLVGTQGAGSNNILATNASSKASRTLNNIPLDGTTVYVRLWTSEIKWSYVDYRFDTSTGEVVKPVVPPVLPTPLPVVKAPTKPAPKPVTKPVTEVKPKPKPLTKPVTTFKPKPKAPVKPVPRAKPKPKTKTYNGVEISQGLYNFLKRIGWI